MALVWHDFAFHDTLSVAYDLVGGSWVFVDEREDYPPGDHFIASCHGDETTMHFFCNSRTRSTFPTQRQDSSLKAVRNKKNTIHNVENQRTFID